MSGSTKIQSTTVQNQPLQAAIPQATFVNDTLNTEPMQTRSKAKLTKMKTSTNSTCQSIERTGTLDGDSDSSSTLSKLDDDEATKLFRISGLQQTQTLPLDTISTKNSNSMLMKRQRPYQQERGTHLLGKAIDEDESMIKVSATAFKKRKLHPSPSSTQPSALIHESPLEIETTMAQQQTDLLSPMSPVPASIPNDEVVTSECSKKEKDDGSIESEEQHMPNYSPPIDDEDGKLEFDRSTGNNDENGLGVVETNNGDDDEYTSEPYDVSKVACQHDQNNVPMESVVTLSKDLTSPKKYHSTQGMDVSKDTDSGIDTDDTSLNPKNNTKTMNDNNQSLGFFKRVASYIFG